MAKKDDRAVGNLLVLGLATYFFTRASKYSKQAKDIEASMPIVPTQATYKSHRYYITCKNPQTGENCVRSDMDQGVWFIKIFQLADGQAIDTFDLDYRPPTESEAIDVAKAFIDERVG